MPRTKQIDDDVQEVLRESTWDENVHKLPQRRLDRKLYLRVDDVLESLGGKWDRRRGGHVFDEKKAAELRALLDEGTYASPKDVRSEFGDFETPDALANAAAAKLELPDYPCFILEPSCGTGQLIRAVRRARMRSNTTDHVFAVEIQQEKLDTCISQGPLTSICGDFLTLDPSKYAPVDRVIMNPPFGENGVQLDIDHVLHAWKFLKPGGVLVAIMSPGFTFRENKKSKAFFDFLGEQAAIWVRNPDDAFKASGTGVNTVTVVIRKPREFRSAPAATTA